MKPDVCHGKWDLMSITSKGTWWSLLMGPDVYHSKCDLMSVKTNYTWCHSKSDLISVTANHTCCLSNQQISKSDLYFTSQWPWCMSWLKRPHICHCNISHDISFGITLWVVRPYHMTMWYALLTISFFSTHTESFNLRYLKVKNDYLILY